MPFAFPSESPFAFAGILRRPTMTHHVLAYAGLADVDAKLEKFAVHSRCAPEWIVKA
jgi:hypothetical protein